MKRGENVEMGYNSIVLDDTYTPQTQEELFELERKIEKYAIKHFKCSKIGLAILFFKELNKNESNDSKP